VPWASPGLRRLVHLRFGNPCGNITQDCILSAPQGATKEVRIRGFVQMSQVPGSQLGRLGLLLSVRGTLDRGMLQVWQDLAFLLSI